MEKITWGKTNRALKASACLATLALTLSFSAQNASAAEGGKREGFNEPFVMAGLKNLKIVVGKLDSFATAGGESEEHIKHLITESLASTHITILQGDADCGPAATGTSGAKSPGCGPTDTPILYTKVKVIPDGGSSKAAAYSISLALVEKAKIARNKKDLMVAVWNKETVGRLTDNVKTSIDTQLDGVLKDFHRDYLLANSSDSSKDVPEEPATKAKKKDKRVIETSH